MASSPPETHPHHPTKFLSHFIQATTSSFASLLSSSAAPDSPSPKSTPLNPPLRVRFPILFSDSEPLSFESNRNDSPPLPELKGSDSGSGLAPSVRISGLNPGGKDGGPAFIGQVFSMCDLSGTGLMAVSTHFNIPFLSKRTPGWLKKMFATITKSERNGPVFHFFMDLGDAVSYVKRLNIPSGVVGACRLDLAYEHFKEKPHLFQFVPNEKQVKAANKLLKTIPHNGSRRRVDGVPVFTAQNLDIAIATMNGIKWYTPYFFDKSMLDNILEESVDQHFHSLIKTRRTQRWKDAIDDDGLAADVVKENGESLWEPPEAQEVMDEMGNPGIPLSVISKVAEMQLLHAVDNVLLGNRWLRKAIGIQPKFPYMVDSFERRSAASSLGASESSCVVNSQAGYESEDPPCLSTAALRPTDNAQGNQRRKWNFWFPFGNWFNNPWSKQQHKLQATSDTRVEGMSKECLQPEIQPSPFLPKITMVGISTAEAGQMSKSTLKKTVEDLTRQLEQTDQGNNSSISSYEFRSEYRDPLFVADVGDYFSGLSRTGPARWVCERNT